MTVHAATLSFLCLPLGHPWPGKSASTGCFASSATAFSTGADRLVPFKTWQINATDLLVRVATSMSPNPAFQSAISAAFLFFAVVMANLFPFIDIDYSQTTKNVNIKLSI